MDLSFYLRGLVIGFSIAAPVGPIGVLCIRRTLAEGRAYGLVSGLGAASADACYGFTAAFGLTFISTFLIDQRLWLHLIGGTFLCYLGIRTFLARPTAQTDTPAPEDRNFVVHQRGSAMSNQDSPKALTDDSGRAGMQKFHVAALISAYASIFFLTLTNPLTILSFAAIFAGLGVASAGGNYVTAAILVLGVFSGSALWWFILSGGVSFLRSRIDAAALQWVNRISGVIITAFGLLALLGTLA